MPASLDIGQQTASSHVRFGFPSTVQAGTPGWLYMLLGLVGWCQLLCAVILSLRLQQSEPCCAHCLAELAGCMITLFSQPHCPQCTMTARTLARQGVAYEVIDVSQNAQAAEQLLAWGYRQVPVVQVGEEHWSGFRPERLASIAASA